MADSIEIKVELNPPDLIERLNGYQAKAESEIQTGMRQALTHAAGSVPSYPSYSSPYRRTGTLGRSLALGGPSNIVTRKKLGPMEFEATFGTRVYYARYVIGDNTQARHMRHWWKMKDVAKRAEPGIVRIFEAISQKLANWLEGRG